LDTIRIAACNFFKLLLPPKSVTIRKKIIVPIPKSWGESGGDKNAKFDELARWGFAL
jgi:hypothetical protein